MVNEEQRKLLYNCMKAAACQVDRGRKREVIRDLRDCDDWVDVLACRRGTSAPAVPVQLGINLQLVNAVYAAFRAGHHPSPWCWILPRGLNQCVRENHAPLFYKLYM